jgi:hypothetical protein
MSTTSRSLATREHGTLTRVLMAGALVGILDMLYSIVLYSVVLREVPVIRVPQSVASGLLGPAAYQGGLATAALGLLMHFTISYGWTVLYFIVSRRWEPLRNLIATQGGRVMAGIVVGIVIWLAMDFVVLPLSRATPTPLHSLDFLLQLLWHPVGVGLPITLIVGSDVARR